MNIDYNNKITVWYTMLLHWFKNLFALSAQCCIGHFLFKEVNTYEWFHESESVQF